ncbi:uncharacterized protein [Haliotis cracherodii]|uniref:uncharacterized protein n=1 Tax=Haliotis cracherodii TaxID=6455 RepID=UPI0039EA31A7
MAAAVETCTQEGGQDMDEPAIERDIRNFVATKTGERVYLYLAETSTVSIRHVRKSGSTVLAIFWIKVLQHQNNYPMQHFPYRKLYGSGRSGEDRVVLSVDGVKLAVFMSSGMLQITGTYALEWFVDRFRGLMAAYTSPIDHPQPLRPTLTDAQESRWKREKHHMREQFKANWPDAALRQEVNVMHDGETHRQELERKVKPQLPDMLSDEHQYIHSDPEVLPELELELQTERLRAGCVLEGQVLYRIWKSLLNSWFQDDKCVVYIVSPRLDSGRLADICRLYLNHRLTATLGALCVPMQFSGGKLPDIKRDAILKFQAKDQLLIEYKIYDSIVYPQKHYQAKFIACVKDSTASVLLTTADFHGSHFLQSCTDTAVYQNMPEEDFMIRYLGPILSSAN